MSGARRSRTRRDAQPVYSIEEVAEFLCRPVDEARAKAVELKLLRPTAELTGISLGEVVMGGPDKVFGSGKRDGESVPSDKRELPSDDQRAYRVVQPGRAKGTTAAKADQRKASRASGGQRP